MSTPPPTKDGAKKDRQRDFSPLRFTGLGLSMMGIVLASAALGWYLDRAIGWPHPILTLVLSLLGVMAAMLHLFKETRTK